jgi:putative sugar O-methyltransferase
MDIRQLVDHFMYHSPDFQGDLDLPEIDNKHIGLIRDAYQQIKNEKAFNLKNFRNWAGQSDLTVPAQLSFGAIQSQGLARVFLRYGYRNLFKGKENSSLLTALLDDVEVIKKLGAENLLTENPVHLTPGVGDFYNVLGTTVNLRWLRYVYQLKRILDLKVLENGGVWVDVGSYYGGLQGLVRKYQPKARLVMVDFHHQLCRSFIYLSHLFPDAKHILPDQLSEYENLAAMPEGAIMYVPASDYERIKNQTADLVTNSFSLGEMRREIFNSYMTSQLFRESRRVFLVNRFVSAPYFEKTYDSDISIRDYISPERKIEYFDIFPIHHYMLVKRSVFGRESLRNVSSPYFEIVTSRAEL